MTCVTDQKPDPPTILMFSPYPTFAAIEGSIFTNRASGNGGAGTHQDTNVQLHRVTPPTLIRSFTAGAGITTIRLLALGLQPSGTYRARMRYSNENGFSDWSRNYFAKVPITLELPAITVPTEPVALTSQPIPIQPSYIVDPVFRRERREWLTETGDTGRRLAQSKQRLATTLTWENLDSTDRDTIKSFLLARVDAVESFATNDHVHGDREWFVRLGRVEVRPCQGANHAGAPSHYRPN